MKTRYVVGEMRPCADCGALFPREVHRRAYCLKCRRKRNNASMRKATRRKGPPRQGCYAGKLPGNVRISRPNQKEKVLRKTFKTPLPFCPVCHHYGMCCEHQQVIYG